MEHEGMRFPGRFDPDEYIGGRIQRVDPTYGGHVDVGGSSLAA
jgi:hypothetical protein